jgi:hypothetical protein
MDKWLSSRLAVVKVTSDAQERFRRHGFSGLGYSIVFPELGADRAPAEGSDGRSARNRTNFPSSFLSPYQPQRLKFFRYPQRGRLIGFQGNFLCQHDVARDEAIFGYKAPANSRPTGVV